jgi:hypothetical protein
MDPQQRFMLETSYLALENGRLKFYFLFLFSFFWRGRMVTYNISMSAFLDCV